MMSTYQRSGRPSAGNSTPSAPSNDATQAPKAADDAIKVDGFGQVLDMLKAADPVFRESLLRGIARQNPELAGNLRRNLVMAGF